jgi:hypothetical protein
VSVSETKGKGGLWRAGLWRQRRESGEEKETRKGGGRRGIMADRTPTIYLLFSQQKQHNFKSTQPHLAWALRGNNSV